MKDLRYQILRERLSCLNLEELQRIEHEQEYLCFDTHNYDEVNKTFCPLAVALNLHKTLINPSQETVTNELSKRFNPVNIINGVKGKFYIKNRKADLLTLVKDLIQEKQNG